MNEIAVSNLLLIFSFLFFIANYIVSSMAMFKISKLEKVSKPWFAWLPICNDYLLIKLGNGSMWFIILSIASLITGGPALSLGLESIETIGLIITAAWVIYKLFIYNRICDRYEINILIFVFGFLCQLIGQFIIIGIIVTIVGHVLLYRSAAKGIEGKTIIESKVVFSKSGKKKNK
ncbi:hypothetical protein [Clostridium sp. HBUAS56017]|uniref:hypothetical protein n=1 Tax=Clostridium sp. HBUAS56017 TaxID=2571128 RepID=UPI0011787504|nr:hypothetical protein [Clostridium sp. HBUAS56017]